MPRRIDIGTKQGMSKWVRGIARDMEREFAKNPISIPVETHGGVASGFPAVAPPGSSREDMDVADRLSEDQYRVLVCVREIESTGQMPLIDDFVAAHADGEGGLRVVAETAQILRSLGLIRGGQRAAGDYYLTTAGKAALKSVEDRQKDRSRRRKRCSWDLLCWIDNMTDPTPGARRSLGEFDGSADFLPYTPQEVADAAGQLEEANLIDSARGLGHPHPLVQITAAGREHRDNPTTGTRSPFVKQAEPTIHHHYGAGTVIHTGDHSQVAVGDHNSQHQEHTVVEQVSAGYEQLVTVLAELLQNIDSFELSEEDAANLREEIEVVRAEVVDIDPTATPDRNVVRRGVQVIKGLLAPAWVGAQAAITTESAKGTGQLLEQLFNGNLL